MAHELLTIEEFAQRLGISRSTAYAWLTAGRLQAGVHVLRIGRVVRIIWNDELMQHLLAQSGSVPQSKPVLVKNGSGGRNRIALNQEFLTELTHNGV